VARTGIEVRLEISDRMPRLPHEIEIAAFRLVQESVGNAVRHARPRRVDVRLSLSGERLDLAILDDGRPAAAHGMVRKAVAVGVGIVGMQERARLLGGRFSVEHGPDGGTARGWLPISRSPA
jgi:signal transduction histidine kinase